MHSQRAITWPLYKADFTPFYGYNSWKHVVSGPAALSPVEDTYRTGGSGWALENFLAARIKKKYP
jgi:hypothetical protein